MGFIVAIDGTAGSGKGTITKIIAEKLNLVSIDTGAMYRCVALECMNKNVDCSNIEGIKEILKNIEIELKNENGKQIVLLNKKDVSKEIRTPKVDALVAKYAAIKEIRDKITPMQRKMGEKADIIMEGRDIGTVVFPNADVKIYLDADVKERARRRYKENLEKGINMTYEEVLEKIKIRDHNDSNKEIGSLKIAEDAIVIDTTYLTIEQVKEKVADIINKAKGGQQC